MKYLIIIFLLGFFYSRAQICSGNIGAPIFFENFGSGSSTYGPPLAAGITTYTYQTTTAAGAYAIASNSNPFPHNFVLDNDHTGNTNGYMMVINGSFGADEAYRRHITGLCPNTTYVFSGYLANNNTPTSITGCSPYIYANVKFQVEFPLGTVQGSVSSGILPLGSTSNNLNWQQYGFVFTTLAGQTTADVVMKNNAAGGCGNDYVVDDISLSPCGPGVALSISPNTSTFCAGNSATLQSTYVSGNYLNPQYQWQFSNDNGLTWNNIPGATLQSYLLAALTATNSGLYRLLIAETGNINFPSCRIIAGNIPISVGGASGSSITITGNTLICAGDQTTLSASGASNYLWSTGQTTSSITVTPLVNTVYTVNSASGACVGNGVTTVSVISSPSLSITGNTLICAGDQTTFTANGSVNYLWNTGQTTPNITVNPSTNTNYTVTSTGSMCAKSAIVSLSVVTLPILSITGNQTICEGQSTVLNVNGASTYSWSTGSLAANINLSPLATTSYSVIGAIGTCTSSTNATINVTPLPILSITGNQNICSGENTIITVQGASNYSWSTGAITASINVNPALSTSYNVIGSIGTCSIQSTYIVNVNPLPIISITGNTLICTGESVTLTAIGANTYTWNNGSIQQSIIMYPTMTSTYTVLGTVGNCTNIAVSTVNVANVIDSGFDTTICSGQYVKLTGNNLGNNVWNTGALTSYIVVNPLATTNYTLINVISTCTNVSTFTVTVNPSPNISITRDTSICAGNTVLLNGFGANSYKWNTGALTNTILVTPIITSNYTIIGTIGTCTAQAATTVSVFPNPKSLFSLNPNPVSELTPLVHFINLSTNYTKWWWNFGDGSVKDSLTLNPSHYYNEKAGNYIPTLTVKNGYGCINTSGSLLKIEPEFTFYIPNSFTPTKNDGINDLFAGSGIGIVEFKMDIFDRWGECVFTTKDINTGWDGKTKNKSEIGEQGTYIWKVEITDVLKRFHSFTGHVTLL